MVSRRQFLKHAGAASLALSMPGLAFGGLKTAPDARFVLLILRGGLDGLAAVPAWGDPNYRRARGRLALPAPGEPDGVLDLDGFFGLHPALANLHGMYRAGEMRVFQGIAPPYHARSHFDAQNVLESGATEPHAVRDGWLYRALAGESALETLAMAIGPSVPLVLRGERVVGSWTPDRLPEPDDDTMARVMGLYARDDVLGPRLETVMQTEDILGDMMGGGRPDQLRVLAGAATRFLSADEGPQVAVLESGGWDTHSNQGTTQGQLASRLSQIDEVLGDMKAGLGKRWNNTAVLVVTEFGRTVSVNGTRGTDHGVGGAAFLAGGGVRGGRVDADWQGLAPGQLFEGRDVAPTLDQRSVFKAVLAEHLGMARRTWEDAAFPDSGEVKPMAGLFRRA